jgi:hypothetical protein
MNPLEDRIQKVPLSQPDSAWRDEILRKAGNNTSRSWKEWVWPSPLAWAALVLIWLGLAMLAGMESGKGNIANTTNPPRLYITPNAEELRALLAQRR